MRRPNEAIWRKRFCDAIGMSALKTDARFVINADRTANHAELEPILMKHFATAARAEWLRASGEPPMFLVRQSLPWRRSPQNPHLKGTRDDPARRSPWPSTG